jgi:Tol biopolymer transport system component/lysophospholipase L1-like esterase
VLGPGHRKFMGAALAFATTLGCVLTMPAYSPAGPGSESASRNYGRIVFISDREGLGSVFTMAANGTDVRRVTDPPVNADRSPVWSPDGSRIAFVYEFGDSGGIALVNPDGSGWKALTRNEAGDLNYRQDDEPSWSPDGTKIAFTGSQGGEGGQYTRDVYVVSIGTGSVSNLTEDVAMNASNPDWSPDGSQMVFEGSDAGGNGLFVMGASGGSPRSITTFDPYGYDLNPAWSPDGRHIAFEYMSGGTRSSIRVIDRDGDVVSTFTKSRWNRSPSWSPDGTRLVFESTVNTEGYVDGSGTDIFVASNLDGSRIRNLTNSPSNETSAHWNPSALDYVALGDSFSSGEGVEPFDNARGDTNADCHRSRYAYGRKFARLGWIGAQLFACSGAVINDFYQPQQGRDPEVEQLARLTGETDLVTLTIGGNDVHFREVVTSCKAELDACHNDWRSLAEEIDALEPRLTSLYKEIGRAIGDDGMIVVLDYPQIFASPQQEKFCATFGRRERSWLRDRTAQMSEVVRRAVAAAQIGDDPVEQIRFVSVLNAFEGHEICENETDRWVNGLVDWRNKKGKRVYSYHPNRCGHEAMGEILYRSLRKTLFGGGRSVDPFRCATK